jgi:hypothetical protein
MKICACDELNIPFDMKTLITRITDARQRKYERENAKNTGIQNKPQDSRAEKIAVFNSRKIRR